MISKESVLKGLKTKVVGKKLFVFESIDSTNACAKTLAETGTPEGTIVVSDYQSAGRGRLGRSWISEPGTNLLFSVVLRPILKKESAAILTFYSAVFIARALERISGHAIECKWPNDLLLNGKKCCGILLENSFLQDRFDFSVIGIGINVNQTSFPDDLGNRATSLLKELGHTFDRTRLLQELLREADVLLPSIKKGDVPTIMDEWNSRCLMFGKPVTITHGDNCVSGTALRLDAEGGLVINTPSGPSTFYAGDVTIVQ
jgi:BirA family biotin operon repressor/biotin-[acetyl-CoA-carboxylase] ligase